MKRHIALERRLGLEKVLALPLVKSCGLGLAFLCQGRRNKVPEVRWLQHRYIFSRGFIGERSKVKVSVGLVSSEASFLGVEMAASCLYLHIVFPLHVFVSEFPLLIQTAVMLG